MENHDKLDSMMADLMGFENEYDILSKQAKVCTDIHNNYNLGCPVQLIIPNIQKVLIYSLLF